ncbi:MAG: AAA-associated domain-containing protein, partial [Nitrososphaerota archaeon]|nr:AAA-associated domain-containing protein [Nitrososphaerota archaeon]
MEGTPNTTGITKPPLMPANVRAGQVMGLVEITGGLGSTIDLSTLADEFGADLVTLLPVVDAGEMLGLIKVEKGQVRLTDFGQKFQKVSKFKVKMLKDQ